jgi:hypothetical protein
MQHKDSRNSLSPPAPQQQQQRQPQQQLKMLSPVSHESLDSLTAGQGHAQQAAQEQPQQVLLHALQQLLQQMQRQKPAQSQERREEQLQEGDQAQQHLRPSSSPQWYHGAAADTTEAASHAAPQRPLTGTGTGTAAAAAASDAAAGLESLPNAQQLLLTPAALWPLAAGTLAESDPGVEQKVAAFQEAVWELLTRTTEKPQVSHTAAEAVGITN